MVWCGAVMPESTMSMSMSTPHGAHSRAKARIRYRDRQSRGRRQGIYTIGIIDRYSDYPQEQGRAGQGRAGLGWVGLDGQGVRRTCSLYLYRAVAAAAAAFSTSSSFGHRALKYSTYLHTTQQTTTCHVPYYDTVSYHRSDFFWQASWAWLKVGTEACPLYTQCRHEMASIA